MSRFRIISIIFLFRWTIFLWILALNTWDLNQGTPQLKVLVLLWSNDMVVFLSNVQRAMTKLTVWSLILDRICGHRIAYLHPVCSCCSLLHYTQCVLRIRTSLEVVSNVWLCHIFYSKTFDSGQKVNHKWNYP